MKQLFLVIVCVVFAPFVLVAALFWVAAKALEVSLRR